MKAKTSQKIDILFRIHHDSSKSEFGDTIQLNLAKHRVIFFPSNTRFSRFSLEGGFRMSNLIAARVQMGNSLAFHIVFVVLPMGMPLMLCIAEVLALWRKDPV